MGNNGSKNDDFSRNPNFNIDQHNQAMRQLQANYTEHNYQMNQGGHVRAQTNVTETEFKAVHRTASIYKPSISISEQAYNLKIQFKYDSDYGSRLEVYIGVRGVEEHPEHKLTVRIDSQLFFQEFLLAGKKAEFKREFSLNGFNKVRGSTVILRIISTNSDERTEYSLKNTGSSHWKILLQKLQFNGVVTQLDNIYKGGNQSDECIICFTEKVNTLIQPCNHLCLCFDCCNHVKQSTNTCPICRTNIRGFKKIRSTE